MKKIIIITIFTIALSVDKTYCQDSLNLKYWETFEMRFNILYNVEQTASTPFNLWGFDNKTHPDYTNNQFSGYSFGIGFFIRPAKNFDFFLNANIHRNQTLIADAGDNLTSGELYFDFVMNGPGEIPPVPNQTYFYSNTKVFTPGVRYIYPLKPQTELWAGIGYNLGFSDVSFCDKKHNHLYSDLTTGEANGLYFALGADFNMLFEGKKQIGLSIFYEGGRLVGETQFYDFLWENYDYTFTETPLLLAHRVGISIHMPFKKKENNK